jgi:hypothetical protein
VLKVHESDITIENPKLLLDANSYPENAHILVESPKELNKVSEFFGVIKRGWYSFPPVRTQNYWIAFGTDPYDPNEEHYGVIVTPTENRIWIPRDINGEKHKMIPLTKLVERVTIRNATVKTVAGVAAWGNIVFSCVRNVAVDGLYGDFTCGCLLADTEYATIRNINGRLTWTHPGAGTACGGWQSRYVTIDNVNLIGENLPEHGSRGFFFESWCEYFTINHVTVDFRTPGQKWGMNSPIYFINGGSRRFNIPLTTVSDQSQVYLWDVGGEKDQEMPNFGTLEVKSGDMSLIDAYVLNDWYKIDNLIRPTQP